MTTEGQGRTADPVGFGIPVIIDGPWSEPRIYPEMSGILDNPDQAYAKLREMGKGLFGKDGAGLARRSAVCSAASSKAAPCGPAAGRRGAGPAAAAGRTIRSAAISARPSAICCSRA